MFRCGGGVVVVGLAGLLQCWCVASASCPVGVQKARRVKGGVAYLVCMYGVFVVSSGLLYFVVVVLCRCRCASVWCSVGVSEGNRWGGSPGVHAVGAG